MITTTRNSYTATPMRAIRNTKKIAESHAISDARPIDNIWVLPQKITDSRRYMTSSKALRVSSATGVM